MDMGNHEDVINSRMERLNKSLYDSGKPDLFSMGNSDTVFANRKMEAGGSSSAYESVQSMYGRMNIPKLPKPDVYLPKAGADGSTDIFSFLESEKSAIYGLADAKRA